MLTPDSSMNILVAEEMEVVYKGIKSMLAETGIDQQTFCVRSGDEVIQFAPFFKPQVVIMNNNLPGIPVKECIPRLRTILSCTILVMFNEKVSPNTVHAYLRMGCTGFLPFKLNAAQLKQAVHDTLNGKHYYFGDGMANDFALHAFKKLRKTNYPVREEFTHKEKRVFVHTCNGLSVPKIAKIENRSIKAIEKTRHNMFIKTGANDKVTMVLYALRKGMMSDPEI